MDRTQHWEKIYQSKETIEMSWFRPKPESSLRMIEKLQLPIDAKIIDIGGGDSLLVDHLLEAGYEHITVLDISATAIEKAKKRLGENAKKVNWIVADAANFEPEEEYDLWHDRAAFHFLTQAQDVANYLRAAHHGVNENGFLVMGTFSDQGPKKSSGIEIQQYSEDSLTERMDGYFEKSECLTLDHTTPSGVLQNFLFCTFRKAKRV